MHILRLPVKYMFSLPDHAPDLKTSLVVADHAALSIVQEVSPPPGSADLGVETGNTELQSRNILDS